MTLSDELNDIASEIALTYPSASARLAFLSMEAHRNERVLDEIVANAANDYALARVMNDRVVVRFPERDWRART